MALEDASAIDTVGWFLLCMLALLGVIVYVSVYIRKGWSGSPCEAMLLWICTWSRNLEKIIASTHRFEKHVLSDFDVEVECLLQKERLRRVKWLMASLQHPLFVFVSFDFFVKPAIAFHSLLPISEALLDGYSVMLLVTFLICIIFTLRSDWVSKRKIEAIYIAFHVRLLFAAMVQPPALYVSYMVRHRGDMLSVRLLLAAGLGNACTSCWISVATSVVLILHRCMHPFYDSGDLENTADFFFREAFCLIVVCVVPLAMEESIRGNIESQLRLKENMQLQKPITTLLSSFCDAIVQLRQDLCIVNRCPKLAALLFLHPDHLCGSSFLDYVHPEDRGQLLSFCLPNDQSAAVRVEKDVEEGEDNAMAKLLHLRMLDSCGTAVRMEVFLSGVRNLQDQYCYHFGIRETEDRIPVSTSEECVGVTEHLRCIDKYKLRDVASQPSFSNSGSSASSGGSMSSLDGGSVDELFMTINLENLIILSCSTALLRMCGTTAVGRSFAEWFDDPEKYRCFFQNAANRLCSEDCGSLKVDLQFSPFPNIQYSSRNCTLSFESEEVVDAWIDGDCVECIAMRISFPHLAVRSRLANQRQRKSRHTSAMSGSAIKPEPSSMGRPIDRQSTNV